MPLPNFSSFENRLSFGGGGQSEDYSQITAHGHKI